MLALTGGIILAHFVWFDGPELLWALGSFCIFAVLSKRWVRFASLLLALVMAGAWTAERHRIHQKPELDVATGEIAVLQGCVAEPSVFSEGREQFTLELGEHARARVSIYLREGEQGIDLPYGTPLKVNAKVRTPRNFLNPGSFDYAGYLARQDIFWTASASHTNAVSRQNGQCGNSFWRFLFGLRMASLRKLESLYRGDEYTTAMMQAMLLGESSKLQKVWTEDFRRTGTFHALVISGIHVSVLAGVILLLARLLFLPHTTALALATTTAWVYALVCGWQPPVVRSAGAFTLFLIARLFYRRGRLLNLLAAIAIGYLFFDPDALWDASFQLSFLSVLMIGALAVPLFDRTSAPRSAALRHLADGGMDLHFEPAMASFRIEMRLIAETFALALRLKLQRAALVWAALLRFGFFIYEAVLTSAIIQIGLALPMILYFHRVSFSGLSANIIVAPLLTAAVPVGFGAILSGWNWVAALARFMLQVAHSIAKWHVQFESNWRVPDPPLWLSAAFVVALVCLSLAQDWRRARRLLAMVVCALFGLLYYEPFRAQASGRFLELTAIDVGQGDGLLVRLPDGRHMLVDTGGIVSFGARRKPNLDIGEDVVSPYLWKLGLSHIDVLAITHWHDDHSGGVKAIIANFHPREIWTGANAPAIDWGVPVRSRVAGESFQYGGAEVAVLAPFADYVPSPTPKNNDSLVLRIRFGEHSFLLTGDIERPVESRLLAEAQVGKIDVLKVAHHGSRTSSSQEWVHASQPQFAIISAGEANLYRLPHPAVVERLQAAHAAVLRTDAFGLIRLRSDGHHFTVATYRYGGDEPASGSPFAPDW